MKETQCAKCGRALGVPDEFDVWEDMAVCDDCEAYERERFYQEQDQ